MMKNIALGQYYSANSLLHALDPRTKLVSGFVFIIIVFFADNLPTYILSIGFCLALAALSKIPLRQLLKSLRPLIFIVAFTSFFNIFWTKGEILLTPENFFIKIYLEGLIAALYMVLRLVSLVMGTLVLISYTTTPIALTHGIESLLSPLAKLKVPVHDFAMMMSIALRFIPTLMEETDKIINAQKARGTDFETGGLIKKAKAFIPIMIPLFVSAFRRADELATAMECRCYNSDVGRTRMNVLKFRKKDILFFASVLIYATAFILLTSGVGLVPFGDFLPEILL